MGFEPSRAKPYTASVSSDPNERLRWDENHHSRGDAREPASFLRDVAPHLPPGRCLDVAAGRGRNALFLAEHGHPVDAIDLSYVRLRELQSDARRRRLPVHALVADLEDYPLPRSRYAIVLCFRYLHRDLWPSMEEALTPGGALVLETFTEAHLRRRPDFPASYCLRPRELLDAFPRLQIGLYRELPGANLASLLAFRLPA